MAYSAHYATLKRESDHQEPANSVLKSCEPSREQLFSLVVLSHLFASLIIRITPSKLHILDINQMPQNVAVSSEAFVPWFKRKQFQFGFNR